MQHRIAGAGTAQSAAQQSIHVHLDQRQMAAALHRHQHQIDHVSHALEHPIKVLLLLLVDGPNVEQSSRVHNVFGEQHEDRVHIVELGLVALIGRQEFVQLEVVRRFR